MILLLTGQARLLENNPVLARSIKLRNPYVDPLNYLQVDVLRRLRALPDQDGAEATALREIVVAYLQARYSGVPDDLTTLRAALARLP